jgi:succinate dehydrogenase / fumarate reductase cytochrome b subunit
MNSIAKKQVVAITGLLLIGFLIAHLAGNFLIFAGPTAFNAYADKLAHLRPGLYALEVLLAIIFVVHLSLTAQVVIENRKARREKYTKYSPKGQRSLASRLMPFTGSIILIFIIWHLLDFTFTDHHGDRSILADGQSYGLLMHGIQSAFQTYGFNHPKYTPQIRQWSFAIGFLIAVLYSAIPVAIRLGFVGY